MMVNQFKNLFIICSILWLISFFLYLPSLTFKFINFDEQKILLGNPHLYDNTRFTEDLKEIFIKDFPREEPLLFRDLSWAIESRIFGFRNPLGYHLGNVLLNAFNAVLLFLFLRIATKKVSVPLAITILFVSHPVHVEPVCWVMGRKDLLMTFFVFLCLLLQALAVEAKKPSCRYLLNVLISIFYLFAIFSKFSAITLFLVLAAYRLCWPYLSNQQSKYASFQRKHLFKQVFLPAIPHIAISLIVYFWYNYNLTEIGVITNRGPAPFTLQHITTLFQLLPWVLMRYFYYMLWPVQLSIFYTWPNAGIPLSMAEITVGTLFIIIFFVINIVCLIRRRDLSFYLLAFSFFILPYCNIVYIGIWTANRYIYVASFCLIALFCTIGNELMDRFSVAAKLKYLIITFICCAMFFQTGRLMRPWQNAISYWQYEAYLDSPSVLSIETLASLYYYLSEQTKDPNMQNWLINQTEEEIDRGINRYHELNIQETKYLLYENIHLSKLYSLQASIARIRNASLEEQLQLYLKAYSIKKEERAAAGLWTTYYSIAETLPKKQSEEYIRHSFKYFLDYVYLTSPGKNRLNSKLLTEKFEHRYPYLADEIKEARKKYF